jgi:hypothetical protein
VEHLLHFRLQRQDRHRLRHPVHYVRDAQDPCSSFLRYFHRADRPREIRSRRHAVPQPVEVISQPLPELLHRHAVFPGRSSVLLHFQPRIPHKPFGNIVRLSWHLRLAHATPSFRLITPTSQDGPAPWLRPHCDTQGFHSYYGQVRQRAPQRYSAPCGFRRLEISLSPPISSGGSIEARLHMFRARARTGLMLPARRTPPGQ